MSMGVTSRANDPALAITSDADVWYHRWLTTTTSANRPFLLIAFAPSSSPFSSSFILLQDHAYFSDRKSFTTVQPLPIPTTSISINSCSMEANPSLRQQSSFDTNNFEDVPLINAHGDNRHAIENDRPASPFPHPMPPRKVPPSQRKYQMGPVMPNGALNPKPGRNFPEITLPVPTVALSPTGEQASGSSNGTASHHLRGGDGCDWIGSVLGCFFCCWMCAELDCC